jgi:hypothetical protein
MMGQKKGVQAQMDATQTSQKETKNGSGTVQVGSATGKNPASVETMFSRRQIEIPQVLVNG